MALTPTQLQLAMSMPNPYDYVRYTELCKANNVEIAFKDDYLLSVNASLTGNGNKRPTVNQTSAPSSTPVVKRTCCGGGKAL
jgi:hypothetical protein